MTKYIRKTLLLLPLLVLTLTTAAQDPNKKNRIDTNDISYVEIVKVDFSGSAVKSTIKKLSKKHYVNFAQKWNSSKVLGADKYVMTYYIYVFLKNGKKRQFAVNGTKIQEDDWLTFDIGDKLYFDNIWDGIK